MNNLLDTHTFIWFINGDNYLSSVARNAIENAAENYISIASLWEIAIKISLGKLEMVGTFDDLEKQILVNGFKILDISFEDISILTTLPFTHRDPFDRLLITQAINRQLTIITKDKFFLDYKINCVW